MVKREAFVNDATTTLNGAINDSVTSVTVTDGTVFPAEGNFRVMVNDEIVLATARATHVLTVIRAQDGTAAAAHSDTDVIKVVLTATALVDYIDQAAGPDETGLGGFSLHQPHRLVDINGNTLTSASFTWINQDTATVTDDASGALHTIVDQSATDLKLLVRAMPTPPFILTAKLAFGGGCSGAAAAESMMGIGFRDSSSGRFQVGVAEMSDVAGFRRYTDVSSFSALSATSTLIDIQWDQVWMQVEDDNANIYFRVSVDGYNWILCGQDTRTAFLAAADELCWAFKEQGSVNKIYHLHGWVEHTATAPRQEQLVNNASTTLNGAINDTVTSVTVTSGSVFPSEGDFRLSVSQEIMLVTARATNVLTVERGAEGTTAAPHGTSTTANAIITQEGMDKYVTDFIEPQAFVRPPMRLLDGSGNVLTKSSWSELNFETSTGIDEADGSITIQMENQDSASQDLRLYTKAEPSTPYTISVYMLQGPNNSNSSGAELFLGFRDSATGQLSGLTYRPGSVSNVRYMTDPFTASATASTTSITTSSRPGQWMRISNDGVDLKYYRSTDGVTWWEQHSEAVNFEFATAPDHIVWGGDAPQDGTLDFTHLHLLAWLEE